MPASMPSWPVRPNRSGQPRKARKEPDMEKTLRLVIDPSGAETGGRARRDTEAAGTLDDVGGGAP